MFIVHPDPSTLCPPIAAMHQPSARSSSLSSERSGDPPVGPKLVSSSAGKQRFSFFDVSYLCQGPVAHKVVVLMADACLQGHLYFHH
jgi:hypothetical protein